MEKITIVEDERAAREMMTALLEDHGYEVDAAPNGREALEILNKDAFPIVITDWLMPEMDGIELVRSLRSRPQGYAYVIMLTGMSAREDAIRGLNAGADDYLGKPFAPEELLARIGTAERIQELQKSLAEANARMEADIQAAARLQSSFIPPREMRIAGFGFHVLFLPCQSVSGDSIGVFRLDENRIGIYIADVAGHGVCAAMVSVTLSKMLTPIPAADCLVKKITPEAPFYSIPTPAEVLNELNLRFPVEVEVVPYFTICYGILDARQKKLSWATAGHLPPLLLRPGARVRELEGSGPPIGIAPFTQQYEEFNAELRRGDRLYLYTDGIPEAMNSSRDPFGHARVASLLERTASKPLGYTVNELARTVETWHVGERADDMAILACELAQ